MTGYDLVFYVLSFVSVVAALGVILIPSPIYSALLLAITMTGLAAVFFMLEAYFLAGVQLIVYAGAVVVLFVMVLMLFDLRKEKQAFSGQKFSNFLKSGLVGLSALMLIVPLTAVFLSRPEGSEPVTTTALAGTLFTKYVFAFEVVGILLLVVLVGAMALAKSRGGTHE